MVRREYVRDGYILGIIVAIVKQKRNSQVVVVPLLLCVLFSLSLSSVFL